MCHASLLELLKNFFGSSWFLATICTTGYKFLAKNLKNCYDSYVSDLAEDF